MIRIICKKIVVPDHTRLSYSCWYDDDADEDNDDDVQDRPAD